MSSAAPLLSVVVPAYNEEKRLPPTLGLIIDFLSKQSYASEIIVVTDGSHDRTAAVAREFTSKFPNFRVIEFPDNKGKGFSVKHAMLEAAGSFRLFMDADSAVPVEYAEPFLQRMRSEHLDILIASRTAPGAILEQRQPFLRQQLAFLFSFIQRLVLQIPYKDTQCGFKMFTAEAVQRYFPSVEYECAYFDAELLYIAHKQHARIGEFGVRWRHDQETRLPIGMRRSLALVKKLLSVKSIHNQKAIVKETAKTGRHPKFSAKP